MTIAADAEYSENVGNYLYYVTRIKDKTTCSRSRLTDEKRERKSVKPERLPTQMLRDLYAQLSDMGLPAVAPSAEVRSPAYGR